MPDTPAQTPALLSGGNPQIPKGEGDRPLQAHIAAMPGTSGTPETRYLDIREDDPLDEVQLASWIRQAGELPGERM